MCRAAPMSDGRVCVGHGIGAACRERDFAKARGRLVNWRTGRGGRNPVSAARMGAATDRRDGETEGRRTKKPPGETVPPEGIRGAEC